MEKRNEKIPRSLVVSRTRVAEMFKKLERQIERLKPRVEDLEARKHQLSVHGYQDLGYFRGRLSAMQDIADELKDLLDSSEVKWEECNDRT